MVNELSEEVKQALTANVVWHIAQPPEAVPPVLVILNYSSNGEDQLLSIAFDLTSGPKCWLTTRKIRGIGGVGPRYHQDYREFDCCGKTFYPYSVESFSPDIFRSSVALFSACRRLYAHAVLD